MSNDLKIFVGNLPFTATSEDLKNLFQRYGNVVGINLRKGKYYVYFCNIIFLSTIYII